MNQTCHKIAHYIYIYCTFVVADPSHFLLFHATEQTKLCLEDLLLQQVVHGGKSKVLDTVIFHSH